MAVGQSTINPAEFPVDAFTYFKGNDGEGARVMSNDRSAIITLTLQQNSRSNKVLSDAHAADLNNGNGTVDISFKDTRGTTEGSGTGASIMKYADISVADTVTDRVWRIWVNDYRGVVGGGVTV